MKAGMTLLERVEVYVDDAAAPAQVLATPPFQLSLDTTTLPDGEHTVRVVTRFSDGRSREHRVGVVVDNHPTPLPEIAVEGLAEGERVAGVIHATVTLEPRSPVRRTRSPVVLYPLVIAAALVGVWAVFALTAPSPSGTRGATNTTPSAAPAPPGAGGVSSPGGGAGAAGAVQFQVQGCADCHMVGGTGGTVGPDLTHIGAALSRADMRATITYGKGLMPAFSTMDPADLNALLDYLQSLK